MKNEENLQEENPQKEEILEEVDEEVSKDEAAETEAETEVETEKKKDKKDIQIEELTDKYKRLLAEFDNYKKRTEKEKAGLYEMGKKEVLEKLLPVIDNFERGFDTVKPEQVEDGFVVGMDKTYKQMVNLFEGLGVVKIEALNKEFDPNFHNAVMHEEDPEKEANIIVDEFQKGYMYKDTVLRHSMVKVVN